MKVVLFLRLFLLFFMASKATCTIIKFPNVSFYTFKEQLYGLRASSEPYISGDTFRAAADFVIDETQQPFDSDAIKDGDVIFVKIDFLSFFFTRIHPLLTKHYILVTHNSDCGVPGAFSRYLDDEKIIAWFGVNSDGYTHQKFIPVPIGVANRHWPYGDIQVINEARQDIENSKRSSLCYLNFITGNYPTERSEVLKLFSSQPWCVKKTKRSFHDYLQDMKNSKFVLSPRGNGLDCYRTWEAMLMGTIPIVKHSTLDPLFEGLPVLLINDWSEVTESFLQETYVKFQAQKFETDRMLAHYWLQKIADKKGAFLESLKKC